MSSRREEKERRRQERLEREAGEARARQRRQRLYLFGGVLLAAAVIVAGAIAIARSGGDDESTSSGGKTAPIPARQTEDLQAAARAAGCQVRQFQSFGQEHTNSKVQYRSNPPTSGPHNPQPADDGIYEAGNPPGTENVVHSLEHGRIVLQYRKGTDSRRRSQLETLLNEEGTDSRPRGYHQLLVENNTNMPYAVAASSWTRFIGCPAFNDRVFDALRAFRDQYTDKAPERVP